ncbi:hypothetical protein KDL29_05780 [bacterium]|nr:hypothetical protein [bacterium]
MFFIARRRPELTPREIRWLLRESVQEMHSPRSRIRMAGQRLDELRMRLKGRDTRDPLVAELFREFAGCITRELAALSSLPALKRLTDSREECEDAAAAGIASLWRYMLRHHGTGDEPLFRDCAWAYLGRCIVNEARDMLRAKIEQRENEQQLEAASTLADMGSGSGAGGLEELFFWCRLASSGEARGRNREIIVLRLMQLWLAGEGYNCRLEEVRLVLGEMDIDIREHALRQQANRLVARMHSRIHGEREAVSGLEGQV